MEEVDLSRRSRRKLASWPRPRTRTVPPACWRARRRGILLTPLRSPDPSHILCASGLRGDSPSRTCRSHCQPLLLTLKSMTALCVLHAEGKSDLAVGKFQVIASGIVVMYGFPTKQRLDRWTAVFQTNLTGSFFPL